MKYQNIETMEVLGYKELSVRFPHISLPGVAPERVLDVWQKVSPSPKPFLDRLTHTLKEIDPVNFVQTWELVPIPLEEAFANKKREAEEQVQSLLDRTAVERGYDSVVSACSYAASSGTFGAEGKAFVEWRDAVWTYVYQVQSDILSGNRSEPSMAVLLSELPPFVLP